MGKKKKNNTLHEEYYICTNKDALNMNKLCFDCSTVCPFCKRVSKKEYDDFGEAIGVIFKIPHWLSSERKEYLKNKGLLKEDE